jgi:hypothetical protein
MLRIMGLVRHALLYTHQGEAINIPVLAMLRLRARKACSILALNTLEGPSPETGNTFSPIDNNYRHPTRRLEPNSAYECADLGFVPMYEAP